MEKRRLLMDLLSNLVAFLLLFNLFAFAFSGFNDQIVWVYLLLAAPFFLMFFLRRKIKKMRYFVVAHFVLLALPFIAMPNWFVFGPVIGFAVFAVIFSMQRRSKGEWNMQGTTAAWVIAVFAGLSLLYNVYLPEVDGVNVLLNISSLATLAAVVLYMHLDNMRFGLGLIGEHHKKSASISPVSNFLITVFLVIIVIFGALSVLFPSEAAVMVLARLLLDIILLPFRFIAFILQGIVGDSMILEDVVLEDFFLMGDGGMLPADEEILEQSVDNSLLLTIVGFITAFILAAIAITFLASLFYRLYQAFLKKDQAGELSLMPDDATSRLKFVLGDFKELLPRFRLGARHPVRRAYIKKINWHIKQGLKVRPHYTPEIIADKVRPKEDIDELTRRYEEVRYGKS